MDKDLLAKIDIIIKMIGSQIIKDKNYEDSAWLLKQCGMDNRNIGEFLGISNSAVSAHHSNKKKKLRKEKRKKDIGGKKENG